jgi:hypothetical protein
MDIILLAFQLLFLAHVEAILYHVILKQLKIIKKKKKKKN